MKPSQRAVALANLTQLLAHAHGCWQTGCDSCKQRARVVLSQTEQAPHPPAA